MASGHASGRDIIAAQRVVGNAAVQRMLQQGRSSPTVQRHPEHAEEVEDLQRLAVQRHPEHAEEVEDLQRVKVFGKKVYESKKSMKKRMEKEYGTPFTGELPKSMLERLDKVLATLPRSHTAGNEKLKAISGGGGIGSNTSAYDYESNEIQMNKPQLGPVDMPWWLYLMLDKSSEFQRKQMDAGAMADFNIDAGKDADLGLTGRREVMGGVSTVLSRGKLVDWTIRHEMGHAVDQQIEVTKTRGRLNSFGGWRTHDMNREEEVARAFLSKASFSDEQQNKKGVAIQSLPKLAAMLLNSTSALAGFAKEVGALLGLDPADVRLQLEEFDDAVAVARAHPWTFSDGGASRVSHGGRTYQVDQYGTWVSYLTSARAHALSNYQFSSPGEWFAEAYAAFYEPKATSAARDRLPADIKKWFATTLGPPSTTKDEGRASAGKLTDDQGKLGTLEAFDDQLADALNSKKKVKVDRSKLPEDVQAIL